MVDQMTAPEHPSGVDPRVVERAMWGDRSAFGTLIRHHDPALRRFAFRLVGDDVDDVLQEAYVRAYRALPRFDNRNLRISAWLHRIVYNAAVDALRGRRRRDALVDLEVQRVVVAQAGSETDLADFSEILGALATDLRAATLLVDGWGFTYEEAAEILDVPAGTVASRLHRARKALRRSIEAQQTMGGQP
jgi:RNA polymerase sigma-70 factor, ECF subfamily